MAKRKPITFNLSDETYQRVKNSFPELTGSEENMTALLDAFENQSVPRENSEDEKYREIVENLCDLFDAKADNLIEILVDRVQTCDKIAKDYEALNIEFNSLLAKHELLQEQHEGTLKIMDSTNAKIIELDKPANWQQIRATLQPFSVELLEKTATKLSEKYGREVEPMQILVDMFLRYTIERWSEWFYPFVLNDAEIVETAHVINDEIRSISQIKKNLPK